MAGLINVNSNFNLNARRVMTKLSFTLGETFMARIVSLDEKSSELLLKLLNGWQFNAKLENPLDFLPNGLVKFEVQGFQGEQLLIKLVPVKEGEGEQNSSIDNVIKDQSLNVGKEDFRLLEKMIKNNIILTKENISSVKTLVDFKNKLELNEGEKDIFINKYVNSKGIDINSDKGRSIKVNLDSFFKELKNIGTKDILTLKENNIQVTDENIISFNKLFKEPKAIYKSIMEVSKALQSEVEDKFIVVTKDYIDNGNLNKDAKVIVKNEVLNKETIVIEKNEIFNKAINVIKDSLIFNKDIKEPAENINLKNENKVAENKTLPVEKKVQNNIENSEEKNPLDSLIEKQGKERIVLINDKDTSRLVKEEITIKTSELKDIIKNLIEQKSTLKPEAYDKLLQNIKGNINDFKVFNSVSNQYYYLDMPLKVRNEEYDCKIIIKDDRKKDKSIDTKNVKLVVTVSTGNMGVVNSYIKVNNKNMNIDIKCAEAWVKVLNLSKNEILKDLGNSDYSIHISVDKKYEEANLINCTDFFNDVSISSINTRA